MKEVGPDDRVQDIIEKITEDWLIKNDIPFDVLHVDKVKERTTKPWRALRDRFTVSASKEIRIFIEDDLSKALKLTAICEIVFLLNHPYNQILPDNLPTIPNNLIRVKNWKAIYAYIKQYA